GIRDKLVTGVQTCALPIWRRAPLLAVRDVELRDRVARAGSKAIFEARLQLARGVRLVVDADAGLEEQPRRPHAGPFRFGHVVLRSEERRVGKECWYRGPRF